MAVGPRSKKERKEAGRLVQGEKEEMGQAREKRKWAGKEKYFSPKENPEKRIS